MTVAALLLLAVALADPIRRLQGVPRSGALGAAVAACVLVPVAGAALTGLHTPAALLLLLLSVACAIGWVLTTGHDGDDPDAAAGRSDTARDRREVVPLAILLVGVLITAACSGLVPRADGPLQDWLRHGAPPGLQQLSADRFLAALAAFAIQTTAGNTIVRLVLRGIGAIKPAGQPQASDRLRGGRLLGPLERLFIVGLGLAGQVTAAGLVIAAKGIIRFPELTWRRSASREVTGVGIDEMTEYFLVGSFVSWLIALTGVGFVWCA